MLIRKDVSANVPKRQGRSVKNRRPADRKQMIKPEKHNSHASPDWSIPRQIDTGGKYSVTHAGPNRKTGSDNSAIALSHMPTTQATNYKHWRPDISPKSVRTFQESQSRSSEITPVKCSAK